MAKELDDLRAAVEANGQAAASAVSLITGLADKLDAAIAKGDETESNAPLEALSTELRAQSASLAEAVLKNTPAAPPVQAPSGSPDPNAPAAADPASGPASQS